MNDRQPRYVFDSERRKPESEKTANIDHSAPVGIEKRRRSEIDSQGWIVVPGITSEAGLLNLARSLGTPVPSASGELVKKLRVVAPDNARFGTFSAAYGRGQFPLHSDTAFWPLPARYIAFRACGDLRRNTTILSFQEFFEECESKSRDLVRKSVWLLRTPSASSYCSMTFRMGVEIGFRYDSQCMFPANSAARQLARMFDGLSRSRGHSLEWVPDQAVVLSNWRMLHGRGSAPLDEGERILERIYVR